MNEQQKQMDQIEREAEALRERLAESLSSRVPSEAAIERVRMAVRHELNEQWLREQAQPAPSDLAVGRTKRAVREVLAEAGESRGASRWWMSRRTWGIAAVAAIALAVGILQFRGAASPEAPQYADHDSGVNTSHQVVNPADGEEVAADVEQLIALIENLPDGPTLADDTQGAESLSDRIDTVQVQLASLRDELSEDTEMVQTLHEIMNDIDELLTQEKGVRQQGAGEASREALG